MTSDIVRTEYERKHLYETLPLACVSRHLASYLRAYELKNMLLRFVFNCVEANSVETKQKAKTKKEIREDPVFMSEIDSALAQLEKDLQFHLVPKSTITNFLSEFVSSWKQCIVAMNAWFDASAAAGAAARTIVTYDGISKTLGCGKCIFPDINQLVSSTLPLVEDKEKEKEKKSRCIIEHAVALQVRYDYLGLAHQGRARDYASMGYDRKDTTVLEAFATSLNAYFPNYCSAFPDLETVFGSQGSFFDLPFSEWFKYQTIFINPSLDEHLINKTIERVLNFSLFVSREHREHGNLRFPSPSLGNLRLLRTPSLSLGPSPSLTTPLPHHSHH